MPRTMTKSKYIWPPRASGVTPFDKIGVCERYGMKPQLKFNDNHLCGSWQDGELALYTRREDKFKRTKFTLNESLKAEVEQMIDKLGLDREKWSYLDGGILHDKHQYFKNTLVFWDILVRDNEYLVGTSYRSRYDWLLEKTGGEPYSIVLGDKSFQVGMKLTDNIFVPIFLDTTQEAWDLVHEVNEAAGWKNEGEPLLEGIMMKDPDGTLMPGRREANNQGWMARCRIKTGRHRH